MLFKFEFKIESPVIWLFSLPERQEKVLDSVRGECILAKNAHDFEYEAANLEVMLDNGNEAVGDDDHVFWYADRIFRFSPETIDLELLFDPFERQLHQPPIFIEQCNVLGIDVEVVCLVDGTSASNELTKHQNQQMVPVRHRPTFGSVAVLGDYSPEMPLIEVLYNLCPNENPLRQYLLRF